MSTISQRLDLRQTQSLVMTPQLQQAIKLLQLNNMELSEFIEGELAQNPLLEKAEAEGGGETDKPAEQEEKRDSMENEFDQAWTGNETEGPAHDMPPDFDPGSPMANVGAGGNRSFDDMDESFENRLSREKTLREHLQEQLQITFDDPRDRMIGALLIDMLDEGGYLRQEMKDLSERLACAPDRLDKIIWRLKQFDPAGIFARDLKECLSVQLEDQKKLDAPMRALLGNLELLAAHDHAALAQKCGVNETYLQDMIGDIRALNPKPASKFDHMIVQTIVPDVIMKRLPKSMGGGWRVELNAETLPRVLVNQQYYAEISARAKERKDREYLSQQLQSANWLVRALDQRAKTIIKTAAEIVEEQDAFFLYGVEYLKPMTLKDIAGKISMHESTVSRVTSNKYIGTPRGIFELKYFFSTALGDGADAHSSEAVKAKIKTMIDEENVKKILSDDAIVDRLKAEGIDIARRTVAKYREAMRIPSSVQRRRQKKSKKVE
ncbi:MAG: RNA polymerase factor sigma-54 [Proteobacteria bacterium]|nr:RNA polymerase factor sigma-54 [Pseudomonadota bacterium]